MMKGPGGRLRFDIRRLWECPVCRRRELTPGDVVTRLCTCSAKSDPPSQNWMKLIEQKPARPEPPSPVAPIENAAEVAEVAQQSPPPATPIPPTSDNPTPHGS
jgi:hypothetical protein